MFQIEAQLTHRKLSVNQNPKFVTLAFDLLFKRDMKSFTPYLIIIFLLLITIQSRALKIELATDNYNVRVIKYGNGRVYKASDFDKSGSSLYLGMGSVVEIPDQFVVRDQYQKLDLQATLEKWRNSSLQESRPINTTFEGLFKEDTRTSTAFPIKIVSARGTSSNFNKRDSYFMDLQYLLNAPDSFREIQSPSLRQTNNRGQSLFLSELTAKPVGLVCNQEGMNNCGTVLPVFQGKAENDKDYFRKLGRKNNSAKVQEYIEYIKPIAQYAEALTGFPASVLIAQSIIETGAGMSAQFRNNNGLFGFSCRKRKRNNTWQQEFEVSGVKLGFQASCSSPRPANEGGHYYVFPSREDSVWAFIYNYLYSEKPRFKAVRSAVHKAKEQSPNGVAHWRDVVNKISGYAQSDSGYRAALTNLISNKKYGLEQLDYKSNSCQMCLAKNNFQNMLMTDEKKRLPASVPQSVAANPGQRSLLSRWRDAWSSR